MAKTTIDNSLVFIVGSPRSGTTILGEILDKHRAIAQWYEPYFMWDRHFRNAPDDVRTAADATPKIKKQIHRSFSRYRRKSGKKIIVDKSPRNSLKIPFILEIFPNARFIHILRDGRDATLSIHKEFLRRMSIVSNPDKGNRFQYAGAVAVVREWLGRQPFLFDKMSALWFETHGHIFNKNMHLNRLRWKGQVGWGPRFKNWHSIIGRMSQLQFSALQWKECVESILRFWPEIPAGNKIEIRYETLLEKPRETLDTIMQLINVSHDSHFYNNIPKLKKKNFNKWQKEFTLNEIGMITTILLPTLEKMGYN